MKLPDFKGFLLKGLFVFSILLPGSVGAAVIFNQSPVDLTGQAMSDAVLNSGYLTSFTCTAGLNCGVSGQTVYNVGVWMKKVGNPDNVLLQVGGSYNDPDVGTTTLSNILKL